MKELYLHSDGTNYDYINNPLDATDPFAIKIKRAGGSERSSYTAATDWAGSDARMDAVITRRRSGGKPR